MPTHVDPKRRSLDAARLETLALRYVERFATSRLRLTRYLTRKLRERGWAEAQEPPTAAIVSKMEALGYVNDSQFAEMRSASLSRRGYGRRRVAEALIEAGIDEEIRAEHLDALSEWEAAIAFARRRRLGPYGKASDDPRAREKALGAFLRAGHRLDVARKILSAPDEAVLMTIGEDDRQQNA